MWFLERCNLFDTYYFVYFIFLQTLPSLYMTQNFTEFCRAHPYLERLRLNQIHYFYQAFHQSDKPYAALNWNAKLIPLIKAISLHPRILYTSTFCHSGKWKSSLHRLLRDYSSLKELEICPDIEEKCDVCQRFKG